MSAKDADLSDAATRRKAGEFVRGVSAAKQIIPCADYPVESGRYHLYVAFNCPWCHRVALARALLGLEKVITMDVAMPVRSEEGHPEGEGKWVFQPEGVVARNKRHVRFDRCTRDTVNGLSTAVEIYRLSGHMTEKSLPILFDKKTKTVVNNESFDIVRMFSTAFRSLGSRPEIELYPSALEGEINELDERIYHSINNGAYRAGFGSSNQAKYEAAYAEYFAHWDVLEARLADGRRFLTGDAPTESDLKLFPTLFRHDPIYYTRMKLNQSFVWEYPHLWRWMCNFYALPGVAENSPLAHMKQGYFGRTHNNNVPVGPLVAGRPWLERLLDPSYGARVAEARRIVGSVRSRSAQTTTGFIITATAFTALGAGLMAMWTMKRQGKVLEKELAS